MADEKILSTVPVTEGTVNISIAEYRGLIEAVAHAEAQVDVAHTEKMKYFREKCMAEDASKGAIDHIETLKHDLAEAKDVGGAAAEFIQSSECIKAEFKLFLVERDLGRKAAEVEV